MARRKTSNRTPNTPSPTWDERLFPRLWPWRIEIAGFFLFVLSAVMLLGLSGVTSSSFLIWVTGITRQLLGWGAYVLFAAGVAVGLHLMVRRMERPNWIRPKQIIGVELIVFAGLALTHLFNEATFDEAYLGQSGGLLGWALAEPLQQLIGGTMTSLLYGALIVWGVLLVAGVTWPKIIRALVYTSGRLRRWADAIDVDPDLEPVAVVDLSGGTARTEPALPDALALQPRSPDLPPLTLLEKGRSQTYNSAEIKEKSAIIERTLRDFGLVGEVVQIAQGPTITQFGVQPGYLERTGADGAVRQHKVPIRNRALVRLRDILESPAYQKLRTPLAVGLGKSVSGQPIAVDLAKMPHLLIAGTTGSGKSVLISGLITALVCNNTPDQLKLVMIDPKKVELQRFNGLPHLIGPVEVEGERVIGVLRWLVAEMERRYELFAAEGARHLKSYNARMTQQGKPELPHMVIFIDELADLMAQFSAEVERTLCRLAQMARATGMHLVVATQRPSTNVITGLIKANFPARIAFSVASNTDSRVIIDTTGADQLLGRGDMLFLGPDASAPLRSQGCFVEDDEVDRLVAFWQNAVPPADEPEPPPWDTLLKRMAVIEETDDLLEKAIALCQKYDTISTSLLQRRLRVGYPRAARIMETLYEMNLVEDPKTGGKTRQTRVEIHDDDPLGAFIDENGEPPSV